MMILGIALFITGVLFVVSFSISIIRCNTAVDALVCRLIEKKLYVRGRTVWQLTPVFAYTANGESYTAKADLSTSNPKKFFVGQKVTVFIDAKNPTNMRYGNNIGFLIAGLVFLLSGVFTVVLTFM